MEKLIEQIMELTAVAAQLKGENEILKEQNKKLLKIIENDRSTIK